MVEAGGRPVWLRRGIAVRACPKPLITAESLALIEEFFTWRMFGGADYKELPARNVDAFVLLEREWQKERRDGDT